MSSTDEAAFAGGAAAVAATSGTALRSPRGNTPLAAARPPRRPGSAAHRTGHAAAPPTSPAASRRSARWRTHAPAQMRRVEPDAARVHVLHRPAATSASRTAASWRRDTASHSSTGATRTAQTFAALVVADAFHGAAFEPRTAASATSALRCTRAGNVRRGRIPARRASRRAAAWLWCAASRISARPSGTAPRPAARVSRAAVADHEHPPLASAPAAPVGRHCAAGAAPRAAAQPAGAAALDRLGEVVDRLELEGRSACSACAVTKTRRADPGSACARSRARTHAVQPGMARRAAPGRRDARRGSQPPAPRWRPRRPPGPAVRRNRPPEVRRRRRASSSSSTMRMRSASLIEAPPDARGTRRRRAAPRTAPPCRASAQPLAHVLQRHAAAGRRARRARCWRSPPAHGRA